MFYLFFFFFFFQAEDGIRDATVTGVQTCALPIVDIEPGIGEASRLQRRDDRLGVADRPARGVDQDRARLHQPNLAGSGNAAAARAQYQVHRENVGAAEQLVFFDPFNALRRSLLRRQVLAPADRLHAKGEPDPGDRAAEVPEAQQTERFAGDAVADPGLPSAVSHKLMIFGDAPGGAEDQAPGELGGILVTAAGTTG